MEDNWSADKQKEHGTYTKTLDKIAGSELSEYRSMAVSALKIFQLSEKLHFCEVRWAWKLAGKF